MISQETIDEIKERANIVDIVSDSVQLKKRGINFIGLCPFHNEKTPSFNVREDDGYYHCFGCGESGNVISFVMQSQGLSFPEAVHNIAARYGIEVKNERGKTQGPQKSNSQELYHVNSLAFQYFKNALGNDAMVAGYLAKREISADCIEEFGIGFAPKKWDGLVSFLKSKKVSEETMLLAGFVRRSAKGDLYDLFRGRLIFPVFVQGKKVAGFGGRIIPKLLTKEEEKSAPKYINSPESEVYRKSKILFALPNALNDIRASGEVLLVEGYMDVIGLWRVGVRNALATCGTAVTTQHIERLSRLTKRIFVLFDGDLAGRNAAAKSFVLFLNSGVDVEAVFFPEGEDPDSIAQKYGADTKKMIGDFERVSLLKAFIDASVRQFGVDDISELGAAAKGKLSNQLTEHLAQVKNDIERNELVKEAAFKLLIDENQFIDMVEAKRKGGQQKTPKIDEEALEEDNLENIKSIKELPRVDQELLQALMVEKQELVSEVLKDADLCIQLEPSTRLFIEGLNEIMALSELSEDDLKSHTLKLLRGFGPSWLRHWKEAYAMLDDPHVDFKASYRQCCLSLKKSKIRKSIGNLDIAIRTCEEEEEKSLLVQEKLSLERKIRVL